MANYPYPPEGISLRDTAMSTRSETEAFAAPVHRSLDELDGELDTLEKQLLNLRESMTPVLLPIVNSANPDGGAEAPAPVRSPIDHRITAATAHVVRLRATFDRKQFLSASSDPLKQAVRAELQQLFERALGARKPVTAPGAA